MTAADCISFLKESFDLSPLQEQRMGALDALYREWNAQINVISRKDIDGLYSHHVLHSLAIARYLCTVPGLEESFAHAQVLDLGTGGGFPGIPLAILYPGASFVFRATLRSSIMTTASSRRSRRSVPTAWMRAGPPTSTFPPTGDSFTQAFGCRTTA